MRNRPLMKQRIRMALAAISLGIWVSGYFGVSLASAANPVPAQLPDPPGKPGDPAKPVKVYILAGQSNMVGMGVLSGASCPYNGIFLSADPAVPKGSMGIGRAKYKISPFGIYVAAGPNAEKGATASVYKGTYDPAANYDKVKPVKTGKVMLGVGRELLPTIPGAQVVVVRCFIEVPESGTYTVTPGFGESACNVAELAGKEVYRKEAGGEAVKKEITLQAGKRYPFQITFFKGGSMALFLSKQDLAGHGDLKIVTNREKKFQWLVDDEGGFSERKDVYFQEARLSKEGSGAPLSPTANGRRFGPELGFGYVMGTYHDAQVLLIKTAQGNRSLAGDFRPPSSGRKDPDSKWEGREYRLMVEGVRKTLEKIDEIVPDYRDQGYEIAGFVWWQGHKDHGKQEWTDNYGKNLVNLIKDVRAEFDVPDMPVAIATVGFGGYDMGGRFLEILKAQMAVSDPKKHPEFAGTAATVDTRPFWRKADMSPRAVGYHYNLNAETYMLVGDALGRAMVELKGGEAEPLPLAKRPKPVKKQKEAEPAKPDEEAVRTALKPVIVRELIPKYISDNREQLMSEAAWEKPERVGKFAVGKLDGSSWRTGLADLYRKVGIHEYDWQTYGPKRTEIKWNYYSFAPKEKHGKGRWHYREVTLPEGMANWFAPGFDAKEAGWKTGYAPFAYKNGEPAAVRGNCSLPFCNCSAPPETLWENEVLLLRTTEDFPPMEKGYRYRLVIGGRSHVNAGDGIAVYINGKKVYEQTVGVGRRQGALPVGLFIDKQLAEEFKEGKVTVAAKTFRGEKGYLALWMQKMKIPPLEEAAAGAQK